MINEVLLASLYNQITEKTTITKLESLLLAKEITDYKENLLICLMHSLE